MWNTTLKEVLKEVYKRDIKEGGLHALKKSEKKTLGRTSPQTPYKTKTKSLVATLPKRCGFATFNSGFACAPLACPSALRLRGSEQTSPTGSEGLHAHSRAKTDTAETLQTVERASEAHICVLRRFVSWSDQIPAPALKHKAAAFPRSWECGCFVFNGSARGALFRGCSLFVSTF